MKLTTFLNIFILCIFYSCNSDDVNPDNCSSTAGPPEFVSEPVLLVNSDNIELTVQTNIPANVYFIVSETAISDQSPKNIKALAQSENESLYKGILSIHCSTVDTVNALPVTGLPVNQTLYAYLVAEDAQTTDLLQEQTTAFNFTTEDEPVAIKSFYSTVKGRNALYVGCLPTAIHPTQGESKLHPLIVFLGGNSEVSPPGQITVVQNGSVPEYISKGNHLPFVVIAPEHNTQSWDTEFIDEVIKYAIQTYPVDPDRIIVTGLSGGGNGTINFAMKYPDVPAAIVPISGWADNLEHVCNLTNMAVWAFHNQTDPKVASKHSIDLIDALKTCEPTKEVKLTIFQDEGHIAWLRIYDPQSVDWQLDPTVEPINIYDWMYQQSK